MVICCLLKVSSNSQFMQLFTEVPPIRADAGYQVVTKMKLLKRRKSVEGAAVYFCEDIVLQMPTGKVSLNR